MYSRDEVKAITDKVMSMAKADAVEVEFSGGEHSATRFANSNITANMVQFDHSVSVTIHLGARSASATTRDFDDASLKQAVEEAQKQAEKARENKEALPLIEGPQDYLPVEAALRGGVNFGPAERGQMVKQSLDVCQKKNVIGSGYIPKVYQTSCSANSKGLFAYYQYAEAGFILTCRTPDGGGSGWAGITGVKDVSRINATELTEIAADKAVRSQKPRAIEPGRYTVILEPRANARFLSLMMGLFNARGAEGPVGNYFTGKEPGSSKIGAKLFSEAFTVKSDVGNDILRQTPIGPDGMAARPITWIEKGVLKNLFYDRTWARRQKKEPTPTSTNMSRHGRHRHERRGDDQVNQARAARHLLLVHPGRRSGKPAEHGHDARRPVPDRERRDHRPGPEFPLEHVAARRLQQHHGRRPACPHSHGRVVRRSGHRPRAAGPDRGFLHDVYLSRGVARRTSHTGHST
jgi:predicted Zn-dependent protease